MVMTSSDLVDSGINEHREAIFSSRFTHSSNSGQAAASVRIARVNSYWLVMTFKGQQIQARIVKTVKIKKTRKHRLLTLVI